MRLKNYVLLSPEAINLDDANRAKLQAVANAEPLALIEYWAVDPDYDGQVFPLGLAGLPGQHGQRRRRAARGDARAPFLPIKPGPRKVCVRVVDVFGFEAEVVTTVEAAA